MCGIVGALNFNNERVEREKIFSMASAIAHRGPDHQGVYSDGPFYMAMRRLSIIDLSTGNQPLSNENRTIWIIFNGEIYNYRVLRQELRNLGHSFTTNTDTEVILHGFEEWGEKVLKRLNGIFAFAIWNSLDKTLFLARDHFGVKPLYYAYNNNRFLFSSELRGLMVYGDIDRNINLKAMVTLLKYGYITGQQRIYDDVKIIPPAHFMKISIAKSKPYLEQYWDIDFSSANKYTGDDLTERIEERLKVAVTSQLVSDVPVGAFLSGGLDSSMVVALAAQHYPGTLNTYTIGFSGGGLGYQDERAYAANVASVYSTNHTDCIIDPPNYADIEKILSFVDEPIGDDSIIPSYFVSQLAARDVKVVLSGLGGDELFGGYERYLGYYLSEYYNALPLFIRHRIIEPLVSKLNEGRSEQKFRHYARRFITNASLDPFKRYMGFISYLSSEGLNQILSDDMIQKVATIDSENNFREYFNFSSSSDNLDRIFYQDFKTYLCDDILTVTDRFSMAHSLEARVPFLDLELVELCSRIPAKQKISLFQKKKILRKIAKGYLPREILSHKKQGFVGPMASWMRGGLKEMILDKINSSAVRESGLFSSKGLQILVNDHIEGKVTKDRAIWSVFVFLHWYTTFHRNMNVKAR